MNQLRTTDGRILNTNTVKRKKDMKAAKRKGMPDICPAYPDNQYKNEKN